MFFRFIDDMMSGFKELSLSKSKRKEFKLDMEQSCETYREKRIEGDVKFANTFIVGELLFTFVIGAVAFVFPLLFKEIHNDTLKSYIFVYLYMIGPVHSILNTIPSALQMKISWNRINEITDYITQMDITEECCDDEIKVQEHFSIELKDVEYNYKNQDGDIFSIGPINCTFNSHEIVFITGGNGSGKSTLARLLTGLYVPDKGSISVNGKVMNYRDLGQMFSAIFADFHLFEKLYGIVYENSLDEIDRYLKVLQIDNKVSIKDGSFSSIKLSTGQRKRLGLLISYLEDRPAYLFDEWAADQDPEFRKFFYNILLPELRGRGKSIIAITHDDRYFNAGDKVIKMETGKIIENIENTENRIPILR